MQKQVLAIITFLLGVICACCTWLVQETAFEIIFWIGCALFILLGIVLLITSWKPIQRSSIQRLVLINNDGECDMEWAIGNANALLIGKSSHDHFVDIDLSQHRYEAFISETHAVLNRIKEEWYIEDLQTVNGVGIKKRGEDMNYRIQPNRPYKIDVGDIIYIAKIRLLAI